VENVFEVVEFVIFTHFLFQICHFYPLPFSVSAACRFHLFVDFTYLQVLSTCTCLALWLALSVFAYTSFSPTVSFQPLCHRNQFSPTMLVALVSHTCRFHLLVDFTYLQTSSTCTCLVDWCCFYYFLRNSLVVLLEPLFARVIRLALSMFAYKSFWPTVFFHPLRHRNQFSPTIFCALVSPTSDFTRRFHS